MSFPGRITSLQASQTFCDTHSRQINFMIIIIIVAAFLWSLRANVARRKRHPRTVQGWKETWQTFILTFYLKIEFISCNWYVLSAFYSRVLIQIGTEPLRNKTDLHLFSTRYLYSVNVLNLWLIYVHTNLNPLYQRSVQSLKLKLTMSMSLLNQNCKS